MVGIEPTTFGLLVHEMKHLSSIPSQVQDIYKLVCEINYELCNEVTKFGTLSVKN